MTLPKTLGLFNSPGGRTLQSGTGRGLVCLAALAFCLSGSFVVLFANAVRGTSLTYSLHRVSSVHR